MFHKASKLKSVLGFALTLLVAQAYPVFAASTPIGAEAIYVEGKVTVLSIKDARETTVSVGSSFIAGDKIVTSSNGVVEMKFDNGNIMRVDHGTELSVKSLHRDGDGSTFSVFHLWAGRVKAAVSRLASSTSKFEYHTKGAIAGVSGTPPFVVGYEPKLNITEVDLLGKKGEPGKVYVQGFDPGKTLVEVFANTRTSVKEGLPPMKPIEISPQRLQQLNKAIPFSKRAEEERNKKEKESREKTTEEKKKEEKKEEKKDDAKGDKYSGDESSGEAGGKDSSGDKFSSSSGGADSSSNGGTGSASGSIPNQIVLDMASQVVTITVKPNPSDVGGVSAANKQTSSEQGTVGEIGGSSEPPPAAALYKIDIKYR